MRLTSMICVIFMSMISAIATASTKYKVGDKVDVAYSDTFYKGIIKAANPQCIGVTYDDGTKEDAEKSNIAPAGTQTGGETKASSVNYTVGEKIDIKWKDGQWYKGEIRILRPCYQVEYIGWNGQTEQFEENQIFPFGSKAKGDTSAAAAAARNKANGVSTKPAKMSADQKAKCAAASRDRTKCMRYPHCEWRDACLPKWD